MIVVGILGICGALVPELLRLAACLRLNKTPTARELIASAIVVLLGLGVLLFETSGMPRLQIAVLGSAFPQLFSGLVAAATPPKPQSRGRSSRRRVLDYLAWRF